MFVIILWFRKFYGFFQTTSSEKDEEFVASVPSSDDEETIKEQEEAETVDHKKEIEDLQVILCTMPLFKDGKGVGLCFEFKCVEEEHLKNIIGKILLCSLIYFLEKLMHCITYYDRSWCVIDAEQHCCPTCNTGK